ncbi:MAG: hypothetical protein NVS2B16_21370 [Chloroflexota bacterium]
MTYGQFLIVFLGVPLVPVVWATRRQLTRWRFTMLAGISLVALIYTGPWDNLIIVNGVWSYGPHQVLGFVVGHVPLEEYLFYILQVFLTGSMTLWLLTRKNGHKQL